MNANLVTRLMTFLQEIKAEVKKITWPSRDELTGSTIIVCILVVVFAIILGSMDSVFAYVIKYLS